MKNVLVMFALLLSAMPAAMAQTGDAEVKIKTSAVCGMCKKTMEKALMYEKGVKTATLDVDSKVLTVAYNPKKTDPARLRKAVANTGYDADEVPATEKAYNQLEDCCKKGAKHDGGTDHH